MMSHIEPGKLPVLQKGWVNDAVGVKYDLMVSVCTSEGAVTSVLITCGISATTKAEWLVKWPGAVCVRLEVNGRTRVVHGQSTSIEGSLELVSRICLLIVCCFSLDRSGWLKIGMGR